MKMTYLAVSEGFEWEGATDVGGYISDSPCKSPFSIKPIFQTWLQQVYVACEWHSYSEEEKKQGQISTSTETA